MAKTNNLFDIKLHYIYYYIIMNDTNFQINKLHTSVVIKSNKKKRKSEKCRRKDCLKKKLIKKKIRCEQDLNLRGKIPTDFKSVALTTRPSQLAYRLARIFSFLNVENTNN
jgi:hypothetical protein